MIREVVASDIDVATRLIQDRQSNEEVLAALTRRGVGREEAIELIRELRLNAVAGLEAPAPVQVEIKPLPEPVGTPDPFFIRFLEVFLALFLVFDTCTPPFLHFLATGSLYVPPTEGVLRWLPRILDQLGAVAFLSYVLFRHSPFGRGPRLRRHWRSVLVFELVMVLCVAFQKGIFGSFRILVENSPLGEPPGTMSAVWLLQGYRFLGQTAALAMLGYVLYRGSRTFESIGLHWTFRDVTPALPLAVASWFLSAFVFPFAQWGSEAMAGHVLPWPNVSYYLYGGTLSIAHLLCLMLNGFFEELIVRAYLMTWIERLTQSAVLAVGLSVAVQVSYHFYQGSPKALTHIGWCLLFSVYYWKTRRALPLALAHNFSNLTSFLLYGASLAS